MSQILLSHRRPSREIIPFVVTHGVLSGTTHQNSTPMDKNLAISDLQGLMPEGAPAAIFRIPIEDDSKLVLFNTAFPDFILATTSSPIASLRVYARV